MAETASGPDLTVILGDPTPGEACANCGSFFASNRRLSVVEVEDREAAPVVEAAACIVCVEHYGSDGIAVRLWPDICDWVPVRALQECDCETCTGQIEFRFNAGSDFYD